MKKTLIVVDMQNDFIDGALGTKEAQMIVGPDHFHKRYPPGKLPGYAGGTETAGKTLHLWNKRLGDCRRAGSAWLYLY